MKGLSGRRALITGGADGIGRAIALRLAQEGAVVGILDINHTGALETVRLLSPSSARGFVYACDISELAAVRDAVAAFEKDAGPIDFLVNNAGWDRAMPFLDTDEAFRQKVIAINLFGPINVSHAVLQGMSARGFGRVVNIASDAGRVGSSGEAVYSACKGGVIALAKTLARELVGRGITVNTVCPGPTDTALLRSFMEGDQSARIADGLKRAVPMRRLGTPDDYPGLVAFLLSDDAAYMTGQTISVSGGLTMHG